MGAALALFFFEKEVVRQAAKKMTYKATRKKSFILLLSPYLKITNGTGFK
jgi:hypothetical protein